MQVAILGEKLKLIQRRTPGAERCTVPSWTSEVRMPELAACESAQVQAVLARLSWARRLRRLTLPPWPIPQGLRERALVRSVSRTSRQWRAARWPLQQPRGILRRCGRAIDAIRCSRPVFLSHRSVTARAAHSAEDWRRHALFTTTSSRVSSRTERARGGGRLRLDAALEAAEDGHVAGLQARSVRRDEAHPRLSFLAWVHHVVQGGRELRCRRRGVQAVL